MIFAIVHRSHPFTTRRAALGSLLAVPILLAATIQGTESATAATDARVAAAVSVAWRLLPGTGASSEPVGILPDGSVVGNDSTSAGSRAWLWSPAQGRRELPRDGAPDSQASAAADSGAVVGHLGPTATLPAGGPVRWWGTGRPRPLEPADGQAQAQDEAQAVNNRGDALVMRPTQYPPTNVALVTVTGQRTEVFPGLGWVQTGVSINDRREAVFDAIGAGYNGSVYIWRDGAAHSLPARFVRFFPPPCVSRLTDTGFLAWSGLDTSGVPRYRAWLHHGDTDTALPDGGAAESQVACDTGAVNDLGHAVGTINPTSADPSRAVLWRGGNPIDLGLLPGGQASHSIALNNLDTALASSTDASGSVIPFIWVAGHRLPLPTPTGYRQIVATGLNDLGQVVGTAERLGPDGSPVTRTVVWTIAPGRPQ
jgi:uncharacterized membrane protein